MKKAWVLSYPLSAQRRLWSDWVDAQADLSLRWAHCHFVFLSCRGSIMFNPTLLFHKTTAVCSFYTPSTFLHTWLIRPPLTIVPRGGFLQVLRYGKLCWLSACVSIFLLSSFIKFTLCCFEGYHVRCWCWRHHLFWQQANYLVVHVECRSYFGRGFVWRVIHMYYKQYDAKSAQMSGVHLFSATYWLCDPCLWLFLGIIIIFSSFSWSKTENDLVMQNAFVLFVLRFYGQVNS